MTAETQEDEVLAVAAFGLQAIKEVQRIHHITPQNLPSQLRLSLMEELWNDLQSKSFSAINVWISPFFDVRIFNFNLLEKEPK